MTQFSIGDRVKEGEGDIGVIRKLGPAAVTGQDERDIPIFGPPATALVEWETLNGGATSVTMQASWEDMADLELAD